jgi:4-amino-4-deoxy-L-arabinose transferase-like glycosyltransferase
MRWWDESLFAVNTYEMIENGNYFAPYFGGFPDNLNTKPPLTLWFQMGFVKLLGFNELAIRLPSAITTVLTVLCVFIFLSRKNFLWAWCGALTMLTSWGFIHFHTARTGDSDALLTFFLLLSSLNFLDFLSSDDQKKVFYFFLFITLAFLTKLFAAFLFIPAYLYILFSEKKFKLFVANKYFVWGLILFLLSAIGVIILRERYSPGYIHEILFKDAGRIFTVVEQHKEPAGFYLRNLVMTRFSWWWILALVAVVLTFSKVEIQSKLLKSVIFLILSYVLIISLSTTKLEWYDMPLFPYLAILSGFGLYWVIEKIERANAQWKVITLTLIFIYPYYIMFDKAQGNTIPNGEKKLEANESYLFKRSRENKGLDGLKIYYSGYRGSLLFYKYKFSSIGQTIELNDNPEFGINDRVLVSNDSLFSVLENKFEFEIEDQHEFVRLVRIKEVK